MVGVVAIGRNEGERLRACLASARRDSAAVVYVDSGSTDGSADLARSLGVHVVDLDLGKPFTAARARNEGFALARAVAPDVDRVQFVDGDCEIVAGWIATAAAALDADPKTAIVCGRRRERFPDASVYNRLCDLEWNTPVGVALACGGDAMVRVAAFEQVGGYDASVIAGEEPEMCVRLRHAGWTVRRISGEMTLHDAAITRFGQWWRRTVRGGHAYAQANAMHGGPPERFRERELRRIQRWAVWPIVAMAALTLVLAVVGPRWCWLGLAPLLLYPVLAAKTARYRLGRGDSVRDAALYGAFVTLGKIPEYLGVKKFGSAQRTGRRTAIIEYKGPATV